MNKTQSLTFVIGLLILSMTNAYSETTTNRNKTMTTSEITKTDEFHSFEESKAVIEALQPYIQSAKTGDGKKFALLFMSMPTLSAP